jgi:hypothetical protein
LRKADFVEVVQPSVHGIELVAKALIQKEAPTNPIQKVEPWNPSAGNIARLTREIAARTTEPLIVMRIVDRSCYDMARIPREGSVAALHHAPHLITAIDLIDACAALWARTRLFLDELSRLYRLGLARMLPLFGLSNTLQTLGASPLRAETAFVGRREEAATAIGGTPHNELTALLRSSGRVKPIVLALEMPMLCIQGVISLCQLIHLCPFFFVGLVGCNKLIFKLFTPLPKLSNPIIISWHIHYIFIHGS